MNTWEIKTVKRVSRTLTILKRKQQQNKLRIKNSFVFIYTDWICPCSTRSSVSASALTCKGERGNAPRINTTINSILIE